MTKLLSAETHLQSTISHSFTKAILLDDSSFDRMKVRRLFRNMNLHNSLVEVESVEQFKSSLGESDFDIIIVDYDLPDGTGHDALRLLRECPRNNLAGSIMITGNICPEVSKRALELGCTACIAKRRLSASAFKSAINKANRQCMQY